VVDAVTVQRFTRFARYWDLVANSGRFKQTLSLLMGQAASPFAGFLAFADWLWQSTGQTSGLTPEALVDALFDHLCAAGDFSVERIRTTLLADYVDSGARANPRALHGLLSRRVEPVDASGHTALAPRQQRHQTGLA
jgi:hypothetical protein